MANKLNNYANGDNNIDAVQTTLDRAFQCNDNINITGLFDTVLPEIAAGSTIEINGSYFKVDTDEAITGSLTEGGGIGYIAATPSGLTASFVFTHVAPAFSFSKNGYYGSGALANSKYLPFEISRTAASVYEKRYCRNFDKYITEKIYGLDIGTLFYDNRTSNKTLSELSIVASGSTLVRINVPIAATFIPSTPTNQMKSRFYYFSGASLTYTDYTLAGGTSVYFPMLGYYVLNDGDTLRIMAAFGTNNLSNVWDINP